MVNIIVAEADNGAIGKDNSLLWHIREDLKYFKKVTMGCPVIMGRRTFESIGRPLPGRQNIVVSKSGIHALPEGVLPAGSLEEAVSKAEGDEMFVIGGGQIYRQALPLADRLYVTEVHVTVEDADTFFPEIDAGQWEEESRTAPQTDAESGIEYEFVVYRRKPYNK